MSSARPRRPQAVKYKLTIAYDGTAYQGWQVQTIGTGVQEKVEQALAKLFASRPRLQSSSRTDTGVHALGMVAHFEIPASEARIKPGSKLALAVNAGLPEDIRVLSAARVSADFHARFAATGKEYRYFIWNAAAMNPLIRHTAWHVPRKLDVQAMRHAAALFIGRKDFRSFTANPGYDRQVTIRSLTRCAIKRRGPLITFTIEGEGFLYKMCRGIVGTLVQVGLGKFKFADIEAMLVGKNRSLAGMTAPAHGLVLWKVYYGKRTSKRTFS